MESLFVRLDYFETYYFAKVVDRVVRSPTPYLRILEGFFGDAATTRLIQRFPRTTPLHHFIEFLVAELMEEDAEEALSLIHI